MGGFNRKQIVQYRDLDALIKKEHSIAYRVTKEEALDLPEQTFENRYITLSKKERNIYDKLRRDSFAELDGGGTITATTVLTKLLRLQQFTGGFLVEDDAARPQLVSRGKLDALADILQDYVVEGKKKLVIFARFIPEVMEIIKLAGDIAGKHGMVDEDIPRISTGGYCFTLTAKTSYTKRSEEELAEGGLDFLDVLREEGLGGIIVEKVDPRTLQSAIKDYVEEHGELSEGLDSVIRSYDYNDITRRKESAGRKKK